MQAIPGIRELGFHDPHLEYTVQKSIACWEWIVSDLQSFGRKNLSIPPKKLQSFNLQIFVKENAAILELYFEWVFAEVKQAVCKCLRNGYANVCQKDDQRLK